jgi:hypothetical protein
MLTLVFTPRESADIAVQIGPVPGVRIEGNTLRHAQSNAVIAECDDHLWTIGGRRFYRADCAGPVTINLEGCADTPQRFGAFKHFSLSDGMVYVDHAVFAQLNSSNRWYVQRAGTECPKLLLLPQEGQAA